MSENFFRKIKRIVSQFFETEWWYRWRKWDYYWFDDDVNKYVKNGKCKAGDYLTSTWDGEGDILMMMRLKIEHQFYNLKHHGNQLDFYLDSYNINKFGTDEDKLLCFKWLLDEYDTKESCYKTTFENGDYSIDFYIGEIEGKKTWLRHSHYKDGDSWGISTGNDFSSTYYINKNENIFDIKNNRQIIEGVIENVHSVNVPISEYYKLSNPVKEKVRGLRRNLTELLHIRRLIKKIYSLDDVNDKYFNMWKDIEDDEERQKKVIEAEELYRNDRRKYYIELAECLAEKGDSLWD